MLIKDHHNFITSVCLLYTDRPVQDSISEGKCFSTKYCCKNVPISYSCSRFAILVIIVLYIQEVMMQVTCYGHISQFHTRVMLSLIIDDCDHLNCMTVVCDV